MEKKSKKKGRKELTGEEKKCIINKHSARERTLKTEQKEINTTSINKEKRKS